MAQELLLSGCTTIPLAGYLKALGVLRLISEQEDSSVRGCWKNEQFILMTRLEKDELLRFFLETYQPTPILAPWNGGSGFYYQEEKLNERDSETGKKIKTGIRNQPTQATRTLDCIVDSKSGQLKNYRNVARVCREIVESLGFAAAPKEEEKRDLLIRLRASLPDDVLVVLDAALILSSDKPGYAPLLGTGWNDGNLDFSNNFMQRLVDVIDPVTGAAHPGERERLSAALFRTPVLGLQDSAIGQFSPGSAGGPNASSGFKAEALINPWDFILMLEGSVLFAASATRRLESANEGQLSYPFTVRLTGSGSGSASIADEGNARAEIWMPLWERPYSLAELKVLLGEGRVTLGRRPARDGLDFVRAIARLGVARGISAFQRYAFLMRSGKAYLAIPLNRIPVKRNSDADLIDQLDRNRFLSRFRRFARTGSARTQQLARRLEDAVFELASGSVEGERERPRRLQIVLQVLGNVLFYLADSPKAREECKRLPWLDWKWAKTADDKSAEYRIAAALAGLGAGTSLPMLAHIVPVNIDKPTEFDERNRFATWAAGSLGQNLARALHRRLLIADKDGFVEKPLDGRPPAALAAVTALLDGRLDEHRIIRLMAGLSLVKNMPEYLPGLSRELPLPAAYCVLKPLFTPNAQLHKAGVLEEGAHLPLPKEIPRLLEAGHVDKAVKLAIRRLRASGMAIPYSDIGIAGQNGLLLLTALLTPISNDELTRVLQRIQRKDYDKAASAARLDDFKL